MKLTHPSGVERHAPEGFSITTLFFGAFVPLLRGDLKWFSIFLIVGLVNYALCAIIIGFLTTPLWWIISAVSYNDWYTDDLLLKGFKKP
jgi:hypothetical protein